MIGLRPFALLMAFLMLTGCQKRELVVLLPEADGKTGTLSVVSGDGSSTTVVLDEAYDTARVGGAIGAGTRPGVITDLEISEVESVTASMPAAAEVFVLYFASGQSAITSTHEDVIARMQEAIPLRPFSEIEIVGHTDTVGDGELNDQLSVRRAAALREALLTRFDIDAERITASGRGERQLAEPTEDNIPSAKNRRVELRLR